MRRISRYSTPVWKTALGAGAGVLGGMLVFDALFSPGLGFGDAGIDYGEGYGDGYQDAAGDFGGGGGGDGGDMAAGDFGGGDFGGDF